MSLNSCLLSSQHISHMMSQTTEQVIHQSQNLTYGHWHFLGLMLERTHHHSLHNFNHFIVTNRHMGPIQPCSLVAVQIAEHAGLVCGIVTIPYWRRKHAVQSRNCFTPHAQGYHSNVHGQDTATVHLVICFYICCCFCICYVHVIRTMETRTHTVCVYSVSLLCFCLLRLSSSFGF